jgi:hypothetical protein
MRFARDAMPTRFDFAHEISNLLARLEEGRSRSRIQNLQCTLKKLHDAYKRRDAVFDERYELVRTASQQEMQEKSYKLRYKELNNELNMQEQQVKELYGAATKAREFYDAFMRDSDLLVDRLPPTRRFPLYRKAFLRLFPRLTVDAWVDPTNPDFETLEIRLNELLDLARASAIEAGSPVKEDHAASVERSGTAPSSPERVFRKSGDVWLVIFDGKEVHIKDSKGMKYIFELLQAPRQSKHSFQLLAAAAGQSGAIQLGSAGEALDPKAMEEYRNRVDDIETRLSTAERDCDQAQKEAMMKEKERIEKELLSALGFRGQVREAHSDAEKARKSVSAAISRAIASIRGRHPAAAAHLEKYISCGTFNRYGPDKTPWNF